MCCCRRGIPDAEIEAVFAKYDQDGDMILNENEQRKLQADLERQKVNKLRLYFTSCLQSSLNYLLLDDWRSLKCNRIMLFRVDFHKKAVRDAECLPRASTVRSFAKRSSQRR